MRFGTRFDWFLLCVGVAGSALGGALVPLTSVIFYDLTNTLTEGQARWEDGRFDFALFRDELLRAIVLYLLLGCATFLVVYVGMAALFALSERTVDTLRKKFLYRVLHQDTHWFDQNEVGKLTQKLSS